MFEDLIPTQQTAVFNCLRNCMQKAVDSSAGFRNKSNNSSNHWRGLEKNLYEIGITRSLVDVLVFWASTQSAQAGKRPPKLRVMHPLEREIIKPEAYGFLLSLGSIGMFNILQIENVLDECATTPTLPITVDHIIQASLKILIRQFRNFSIRCSQ